MQAIHPSVHSPIHSRYLEYFLETLLSPFPLHFLQSCSCPSLGQNGPIPPPPPQPLSACCSPVAFGPVLAAAAASQSWSLFPVRGMDAQRQALPPPPPPSGQAQMAHAWQEEQQQQRGPAGRRVGKLQEGGRRVGDLNLPLP